VARERIQRNALQKVLYKFDYTDWILMSDVDDELKDEIRKQMKGMEVMFFSSVTEQGVGELIDVLWATVSADV
jgi:hypothetical protein